MPDHCKECHNKERLDEVREDYFEHKEEQIAINSRTDTKLRGLCGMRDTLNEVERKQNKNLGYTAAIGSVVCIAIVITFNFVGKLHVVVDAIKPAVVRAEEHVAGHKNRQRQQEEKDKALTIVQQDVKYLRAEFKEFRQQHDKDIQKILSKFD